MKSGAWIIIAIVVIAVIGVGIFYFTKAPAYSQTAPSAPSASTQPSTQTPPLPEQPAKAKTYNIEIRGFAFNPSSLTIKAGDTVTWTNEDSVLHKIASDSGNELSSDALSNGQTYSHTFTVAGIYSYHCGIHTSMKGTIIVQ